MKSLYLSVALAGVAVVASAPARAEAVDMSTVTCSQLLGMQQDEITFMLTWVAGYMAGTAEETSMDPDALGKHVQAIVTYCGENPEMSVMNAGEEAKAE
ncbi:MAG: hypothetical protein KF723_07400 [Rhizobiaceae bacterium]|nr:hypothetical protein [Rhizobiaceae bacterium]